MTEMFDGPQSSAPASTEPTGSSEITASGTSNGLNTDRNTKDTAGEVAQGVAQEGLQGGKHVASVAADQAKGVVSEAGSQAKGLLAEAKSELSEQAASQKKRVEDQLHTLAQEFGAMASKSDQDGLASGLAEQASRQAGSMAHWLSAREPGSLVGELKDFARARPGTFLAVAAGIGLVAGRVTRGIQAGPPEKQPTSQPAAQEGMAAVGLPAGPPGMVPGSSSVEGLPNPSTADLTVGVGALHSDMVGEEPLPSRTPGIVR